MEFQPENVSARQISWKKMCLGIRFGDILEVLDNLIQIDNRIFFHNVSHFERLGL